MNPFLSKQCILWPITATEKEKVGILFFFFEWFSTASLLNGFMINPVSTARFLNKLTRVKKIRQISQPHSIKFSFHSVFSISKEWFLLFKKVGVGIWRVFPLPFWRHSNTGTSGSSEKDVLKVFLGIFLVLFYFLTKVAKF